MRQAEIFFPDLMRVLEFLQSNGFSISRPTLYRHKAKGLLQEAENGGYMRTSVESYAYAHLRKAAPVPAPPPGPEVDNPMPPQERKVLADAKRAAAMAALAEQRAKKESGAWVHRDEFERALAGRAAIFKQDLVNLAHTVAPEICASVAGDDTRLPELVGLLLKKITGVLARYSEPGREFEVKS